MSNQTSSSSGSTGFDNLSQNYFGLVALIVSVVALCTTILQVLQQYFSSAEGYRRCHKSVIDLWAKGTRRKLRFRQFRFEVVFETPVIFTAPPWNDKGPIKGKDIYVIDGTQDSYVKTRVRLPEDQAEADSKKHVHTADDERASWVTLLSTLQAKEKDSRDWDILQRTKPKAPFRRSLPPTPKYELAAAIQSKARSWDFVVPSITKPYATSAICHLVELMAMLGLYWKSFDQAAWNLRAEGNGFILTSTHVHGLGVVVVFATTGKSSFKENRVIPCKEIKDLAFGLVPNIFEDEKYLNLSPDHQSLDLMFSSENDMKYTLESLGCQATTIRRWPKDHKHIFSLSFEIIGMLGQVLRLRGSSFRMIPNPTTDQWSKTIGKKISWSMTQLMRVFQQKVEELIDNEKLPADHHITQIHNEWQLISDLDITDDVDISLEAREAIHDALDESTTFILSLRQLDVLSVLVAHITKVIEVLVNPQSPLNTIVLANKEESLLGYYFTTVRPEVIRHKDSKGTPIITTDKEKDERNIIWVSLMYRMLCWFLLHDFDRVDLNIVPADLRGSRMPIFIG